MSAVLRILGWKAEGLRCPDHEIRCGSENGNTNNVTLVQMPNGTGKTTTLELLRAALSGSAGDERWDRSRISEYRKRDSNRNDGLFEVSLLLSNRRVTIRMEFDFETNSVLYKTSHSRSSDSQSSQSAGQRVGFHPPSDFRRFMNENFVSFYVFDGELAQRLLDREYMDAESVVTSLFQIDVFHELSRKVARYWEEETKQVNATEERGLNRRLNRLKSLKKRKIQLIAERDGLLKAKDILIDHLQNKEEAYKNEILKEKALSDEITLAEEKVQGVQSSLRNEAQETLDAMLDPHAISSVFAQSMMNMKTNLDRVKLPESVAKEFFEELAEESYCVCGRSIDDDIRTVIKVRAKQYLDTDDIAFLNSMKSAIQDAVGSSLDGSAKALNERLETLGELVQNERTALNDLETLQLEAERSDPSVKTARDEIDALTKQLEDINDKLEKYESKDKELPDDKVNGIEEISRRIEDAETKVAEITQTIKLKSKRDSLCEILNNAHQKARDWITSEICVEANERISELLPYNNILIDKIDKCLVLKEQEGGSAGETLSVAWGFLATLFHRSDHKLPFVVDSPAGAIDLAVRPKIGDLIPKLTGQFIAFTISSERAQFVSQLKKACTDEVRFVTVFRKGPASFENQAKEIDGSSETSDGFVVPGEAFFNSFQLDIEEESA